MRKQGRQLALALTLWPALTWLLESYTGNDCTHRIVLIVNDATESYRDRRRNDGWFCSLQHHVALWGCKVTTVCSISEKAC